MTSQTIDLNRLLRQYLAPVGLFVLLLVVAVSPDIAHAASLRCDKAILQEGSHLYEVTELCGEPVAEYSRIEYLHPNVPVYVDEWVYQLGDNKFQRMLRFENGRLRDIRTLRKPQVRPNRSRGSSQRAAEYRISW